MAGGPLGSDQLDSLMADLKGNARATFGTQRKDYDSGMLDTHQLEVFQQVVDCGSFSAAARTLRCTQPAVSQQIRALERSLGGPLFIRVGRGLQLTEAGTVLARRSQAILGELAVARQQVRAVATLEMGTVRVCAFPSANASIVPRAAAMVTSQHPHMHIELIEDEPPDSFQVLRRAECDLVIAFSYRDDQEDPQAAGMQRIPLMDDPLSLLVPATHTLAGEESVRLADLSGLTWVAGCPRCRQTFTTLCLEAGFMPTIACATDDNMALQSLVAAGLGAAFAPGLVYSFLLHPAVVAVPIRPVIRRHIAAYTWPDLGKVPAVEAMITALAAASSDL
jgi:DNA-binding transcriptional LysR family regulator